MHTTNGIKRLNSKLAEAPLTRRLNKFNKRQSFLYKKIITHSIIQHNKLYIIEKYKQNSLLNVIQSEREKYETSILYFL